MRMERMATIEVDEQTAQRLKESARIAGVTIAEFVRTLVVIPHQSPCGSWDALEREFTELGVDGSLPVKMSRSDFYDDHQ